MAVLAISYMDRLAFSVLVESIKADLDLSDGQIGLLSGVAFALFYAAFGLPLARWVDRGSRVALLTGSMVVWSLATAATGLAGGFAQIFAARLATGAGEAACIPAGHSIISGYVGREDRAKALGVFHTGGSLGIIGGMALAGVLADAYGWRAAFVLIGLPGVLVALLLRLSVREPARAPESDPAPPGFAATLARLLRRPTLVHVTSAFALFNFSINALNGWLPAFYQRLHGLSVGEVGLAVGTLNGVGSGAGLLLGGFIVASLLRRDARWSLWFPGLALLIGTPLYLGALAASDVRVSLGLLFFASLTVQLGAATALATVHSVSAPSDRGQAIALVVLFSAVVGQGAGPLIVGLLSDALGAGSSIGGLRTALLIAMTGFGWAIAHYLLASRTLALDTVD